jgi:hypothetical protein
MGTNPGDFDFKYENDKFAKYMIISKAKNTSVSYT